MIMIIIAILSSISLICIIGLTVLGLDTENESKHKSEIIHTLCHRLDLVNSGAFNTTPSIHVQVDDVCK